MAVAQGGDEALAKLLTPESPVGPASADELRDRKVAQALYDTRTGIEHVLKETAPVFLIGRRGSGKTAVLKGSYPDGGLDVTLDAAEMLHAVAGTLEALSIPPSSSYGDLVTPVWRAVFWAALCASIHSDYCKLTEADCPAAFAFGALDFVSAAGPGTDAGTRILESALRQATPGVTNVARFFDQLEINGVPLWRAREDLIQAARANKCQAIVSIDSLDQYDNFLYEGGFALGRDAQALQGLFRASSANGREHDSIFKVRVSFPAELWHHYNELSTNPLKDFDNSIILHWGGGPMLEMVAWRFMKYLEYHHSKEFKRITITSTSSRSAKWAQRLFLRYIPAYVTNGLGTDEPSISYLLRHTQLLPRHMIHVVNSIFRNQPVSQGAISSRDVQVAVNSAANIIANTVINAYKLPYPFLLDACETVIKQLPLRFTTKELHQAVNRSPVAGEFTSVLRGFVEAGIVGRVLHEHEQYVKAQFEYLEESRMYMVADDDLCLHPVFASRFECSAVKDPKASGNEKPIYPFGSDLESDLVRTGVHLRA